jgi:hypothetical protein
MRLKSLFDPANRSSISQKFRERRFKFFRQLLGSVERSGPVQILDIGGTEEYWQSMDFTEDRVEVTLLNLTEQPTSRTNFHAVVGNACDLSQYADKSFDIVFSNSVIEHLFTWESQQQMAREVIRVGKFYYVQTPNYWFPLEPHWLFPFFQYLPFSARVFLTKNFSLGHYPKTSSHPEAVKRVNEVRLLSIREMKTIFPNGQVYLEKFLGLNKSITMYSFE